MKYTKFYYLSPTDFLTRLLLCSAIRVNSIALAYRNNSQILYIFAIFSPKAQRVLVHGK